MAAKGIVPDFQYDLFISYSHANNRYGWVTNFQEDLTNLLWEQLGAQPRIWWDQPGLDGQAVHAGIREAVYQSAVFVPVTSIAFLASEYCIPFELNPFATFQHPAFPLVVGTCKRIVVIGYDTEGDCPRSTWPEVLHDAPFVSFCDTTATGDRCLWERLPVRNPRDVYWERLGKAVRHLRAVLTEMRKGPSGEEVAQVEAPATPVAKVAPAWRARWKRPAVYVRFRGVDVDAAEKVAGSLAKRECDVTYLESEKGEQSLEAYLQRSDAEILYFKCELMDWARLDVLRSRDVAGDHGRPKRLGLLVHGECPDKFGMMSDFIVPLRLNPSGEIDGLDRLLEGLSG
jgi:hypothetical protein